MVKWILETAFPFLKLHLTMAILTIVVTMAIVGTIRVMLWRERAHQTDSLQAGINAHIADEKHNEAIGLNLETGLNDYRTETRGQSSRNADVFTADSMQFVTQRIAAGEAARQRVE